MQKTSIATCVLLLLLFFIATSVLEVESALGLKVSVQWGHLSPDGDAYYYGEHDAENWICDQVYQDFVAAGNWGYSNAYWTYTTQGWVQYVLQWEQNPANGVNFGTNWWVGDFAIRSGPDPFGHLGLWGDGGQHIYDNVIYVYANYYFYPPWYNYVYIPSKQYFDFIWTCMNGGLYWYDSSGHGDDIAGITYAASQPSPPNPTNTNTKYGFFEMGSPWFAVGVPLGWTGTTGMHTDGYGSPDWGDYCYVGWEAWSPYMVESTGYNGMYYKWFPYYFYRYALGLWDGTHHTFKDSLDFAASQIFGYGSDYWGSELHNGKWVWCPFEPPMQGWWYRRMRVFGNGNLILPY